MKPYQHVAINECGEPLVPIPLEQFAVVSPHPYVHLGAPYGDRSPYFLRTTVLQRLHQAQVLLQESHPAWRIEIFDAYRPIAVQQFMVEHAFAELLQAKGLTEGTLSDTQRQALMQEVSQFWATPSHDPRLPPPHSTGAALDVTLVDEHGTELEMGSPIDELSPRSFPNYFAPNSPHRPASDPTPPEACDRAHQHRQLLHRVMHQTGFQRHPNEWWHFSYGDQLWAWLTHQQSKPDAPKAIAHYGTI